MIIAEAKCYRTDGKLFETEEEAQKWNKLTQYKEAIGNLGEMNEPSVAFLISIANTKVKRLAIAAMLVRIDEIDAEYDKLTKDA